MLAAGEIDPQINVTANNVTYDEDATIDVSVVDKNDSTTSFNNSIVSIFIDDAFIENLTLNEGGKASYVIPAGTYGVGSYHIFALMNDKFSQTMLNINKATPIVNVDNVEAVTGTIIKIPFNVTDSKGKGIDGDAVVTIKWSDDVISKHVKIVDGKANVTFDISDLMGIFGSNNTFNISSMFGENGTFNMSFGNFSLGNITNLNISTMFGENGTFNISALFGGNGTFNISSLFGGNGTGFNLTNLTLGNSTFNFTNMFNFNKALKFAYVLEVGTYDLEVIYLPSRNYSEARNNTAKLVITYDKDVVYFCDITTPEKYGDNTTVSIVAVNKYGNPLSNGTINIKLNGEDTGNVTLDENGTAVVVFEKLLNGDYQLMFDSNGTNETTNFTVSVPMKTSLTSKAISILTVNTAVDGKIGKYLSVTLKDVSGALLANKTVKIAIDGKINNVKTDSNGVAKLQLNIAKAGVYTASLCFLGEDVYTSSFNIVKVTVNKQAPKLTSAKKAYKANAKTKTFTATLKSAKGKVIKGKKVTFKVNGKTYSAKTNSKGVATIKVSITKKGNYGVAIKFAGDNTYKAVNAKSTLTIK